MIRSRSGDFVYSDLEFDDIISERTRIMIELSRPQPFTLHRAFDVPLDLFYSLTTSIHLGIDRVLSSGGLENVANVSVVIQSLNQSAKGRIGIHSGGGINASNIDQLLYIRCDEFHITGYELHKSPVKDALLRLNGIIRIFLKMIFWQIQ